MFQCDLCLFNCNFKRALFRHKARAHFDQVQFKFKCDTCRTGFSNRSTYQQHINTIHKDNGARFKCTIKYKNQVEGNTIVEYECGKTFQILISARRHLQLLHKIQTKDCEEAKKYFTIVKTSVNLLRRSKFCYYYYGGNQHQPKKSISGGNNLSRSNQNSSYSYNYNYVQNRNRNIKIKEEEVVPPEVDDPDEILKILENNETDDVESNSPCSSENICIIEEKFIPDVTSVFPIDDVNEEINDNTTDQNKEKDFIKTFVQKLAGKSKVADKKTKLGNLQSNKVTTKPQQVPKRANLSRSCKNSADILQLSSTRQQLDSESEYENESEPDSESELFKSKSILKVKSPKNKSSTRQQLDFEAESEPKFESESDTDFEPEPEIKPKVKDKNQTSLSCHLCQKKFSRPDRLRHHLVSRLHPENRVECTKCPKSHYVVKGTLIKHHKDIINRLKAKKNSDLVSKSEPKFESKSDTDFELEPEIKSKVKNSQKDKNETSYSCHLCQKKFSWKSNLRRHLISSVHPENRVKCIKCPQSHYVGKETLVKHHQDVKCGRNIVKNIQKPKSTKTYNPKVKKTYKPKAEESPCTYCDKVFGNKFKLKSHQKYCTITEKNFNCKDCNLSFKTFEILKKHLRTNSRHAPNSGKRYLCQKCSSGFTKATDLAKHVRSKHENDGTRFECKICCTSYGRYDSLLGHLKKEEHKLREQDFKEKYQNQDNDNPIKIKKET